MTVNESVQPARRALSDHMRVRFKGVLDPVAGFLLRLGLMPNTITLLGLAGNAVSVVFCALPLSLDVRLDDQSSEWGFFGDLPAGLKGLGRFHAWLP